MEQTIKQMLQTSEGNQAHDLVAQSAQTSTFSLTENLQIPNLPKLDCFKSTFSLSKNLYIPNLPPLDCFSRI